MKAVGLLLAAPVAMVVALPAVASAAPAGAAGNSIWVPCSGARGGEAGLVAAIEVADARPGGASITLAQGCTYIIRSMHDFADGGGLPAITSAVRIGPPGSLPGTTIRRAASADPFGVVNVDAGGVLTLTDVTIAGGLALDGFVGAGLGIGFGGTATLVRSRVTGNAARADTRPFAFGGGIYNAGSLTLASSEVDHNSVVVTTADGVAVGGGIASEGPDSAHPANLVVDHSTIGHNGVAATNGTQPGAVGGGIATLGVASTSIDYSDIADNQATAAGAGSAALGAGLFDNLSFFSGIAATTLTTRGTTVEGNTANAHHGFGAGAGLYSAAGDHSLLRAETVIVGNAAFGATADGGGIYLETAGSVSTAPGSTVVGNIPNNCGPHTLCP